MKQIVGYETINEAGELKRLPAGPQAVKITDVIDSPERELLEIYFDIVEGEFKGYFKVLEENTGRAYGKTTRSYKVNALPFFKAFITSVEKSNPGYVWNWDEKSLIGKFTVCNFREEEYVMDGEVKVSVKPFEFRSLPAFRAGEVKVPPRKCLAPEDIPVTTSSVGSSSVDISDDDLPF